ncbi:L-serine ammonia-lyase, iron-sulfur-dependent, subunit alpha [Tumebacillus algifaecis]|uniref:L-serine dehydratase n=1 Tax=Tumebacillus algifaecis TaxID=1214604 RepID=A0A223D2V6_9BACL|nr:L-serine ammonia-lyase, iron-sulfur-dependent, subunit alpha [Tumebacillus algifaecis]ASS75714.1 L-serine ammonia-lyase, iron-sulfur-dependent, subunit alpha [Tumebacillus algifaecis]
MRFKVLAELVELAEKENKPIYEIMIEEHVTETGETREKVIAHMTESFDVMMASVERGLKEDIRSFSGLTGGDAKRVYEYAQKGKTLLGKQATEAMAMALSTSEVNAAMGLVVATPTAGSCGILPGVLSSLRGSLGLEKEQLVLGMFTAAAVGYVVANNASISGAGGGCQAEVGSATAMAAAAAVELAGGTPSEAIQAAGLALKNLLGLVCDPVAGLVEIPCIIRNGFGSVLALAGADMALAGVRSVIPPDEVIMAMYNIGKVMPVELRETAMGGLADTPTARKLERQIYGNELNEA